MMTFYSNAIIGAKTMQARVDALVCASRCVNVSDCQFSELTELLWRDL